MCSEFHSDSWYQHNYRLSLSDDCSTSLQSMLTLLPQQTIDGFCTESQPCSISEDTPIGRLWWTRALLLAHPQMQSAECSLFLDGETPVVGMPLLWKQIQQTLNYFFTLVFLFEMLVKMAAYGIDVYLSDSFNIFDSFVVLISIVETVMGFISNASGGSMSALRALRLFRVFRAFKMARRWTSLRRTLACLVTSSTSLAPLTLLLFLFIFMFSLAGMQLFGEQWNPDHRFNFVALFPTKLGYGAILTIFQILTLENWNEVMISTMEMHGKASALYFVLVICIGVFMVMNLFVAVLLDGFSSGLSKDDVEVVDGGKITPIITRASFRSVVEICSTPRQISGRIESQTSELAVSPLSCTTDGNGPSDIDWVADANGNGPSDQDCVADGNGNDASSTNTNAVSSNPARHAAKAQARRLSSAGVGRHRVTPQWWAENDPVFFKAMKSSKLHFDGTQPVNDAGQPLSRAQQAQICDDGKHDGKQLVNPMLVQGPEGGDPMPFNFDSKTSVIAAKKEASTKFKIEGDAKDHTLVYNRQLMANIDTLGDYGATTHLGHIFDGVAF